MSQQKTVRHVNVGRTESMIRKQTYIMSQIHDVQSKIWQEFQIIKINEQKYNLFLPSLSDMQMKTKGRASLGSRLKIIWAWQHRAKERAFSKWQYWCRAKAADGCVKAGVITCWKQSKEQIRSRQPSPWENAKRTSSWHPSNEGWCLETVEEPVQYPQCVYWSVYVKEGNVIQISVGLLLASKAWKGFEQT